MLDFDAKVISGASRVSPALATVIELVRMLAVVPVEDFSRRPPMKRLSAFQEFRIGVERMAEIPPGAVPSPPMT